MTAGAAGEGRSYGSFERLALNGNADLRGYVFMKNIQIIDGADNATFSIFQATDEEFAEIFPKGQDIELAEDFCERVGDEQARVILTPIWERPILKRDANGIHGTLYYGWQGKRKSFPASKQEVDWVSSAINAAQRRLYRSAREGC